MDLLKTIELKITGKVQGVWFRKYTKNAAYEFGISGFVRNEKDKSVYVIATGTQSQLNDFIQFCHNGSPLSEVDKVIINEYDTFIEYAKFAIK